SSFSPASVILILTRPSTSRFWSSLSSFSPASVTWVRLRWSFRSCLLSLSSLSPASVTLVRLRSSSCSCLSSLSSFSPASVTCVTPRSRTCRCLHSLRTFRSASVVSVLRRSTATTGLPGALSSRRTLPPRFSTALTASSSSARAGPASNTAAITAPRSRRLRFLLAKEHDRPTPSECIRVSRHRTGGRVRPSSGERTPRGRAALGGWPAPPAPRAGCAGPGTLETDTLCRFFLAAAPGPSATAIRSRAGNPQASQPADRPDAPHGPSRLPRSPLDEGGRLGQAGPAQFRGRDPQHLDGAAQGVAQFADPQVQQHVGLGGQFAPLCSAQAGAQCPLHVD